MVIPFLGKTMYTVRIILTDRNNYRGVDSCRTTFDLYRVTKKNVTRLDFNKKLEVSISKEIAVFVLLFFSNFLYTDLQWISDVKY